MEQEEFEAEARRLLAVAGERGITLRLLGALAFRMRCPAHAGLQQRMGRTFTDLDFAAYGKQAERIRRWLAEEGYVEDPGVYVESQGSRLVLAHAQTGLHLPGMGDARVRRGRAEGPPTPPAHRRLLERRPVHPLTAQRHEARPKPNATARFESPQAHEAADLRLRHPLP